METDPRDRIASWHHTRAQDLWERVERLRPAADDGDAAARERLFELLFDGGACDDLRARAHRGDVVAGEDLADLLAERGRLAELAVWADRGHTYAADTLADLYLARGDTEGLQTRADAGDPAARLRLDKIHTESARASGAEAQVAELRAAISVNPAAGRRLCTLLFELRDGPGLQAELEAGTPGAADRLIALYTADELLTADQLARLRAFGLTADGTPAPHTFRKDF
jgi:hypothetical protein